RGAQWRRSGGSRSGFGNDRTSPPSSREGSQCHRIHRVVPLHHAGLFSMNIRSIVFNALFYLNLIVQMLAVIPTMLMPRGAIVAVVKSWPRTSVVLLRSVCGITVEFRGLERIPPGALIVASKHQSMWETFALFPLFADPAFILKRELMWIPFFGWFSWKAGMIPVNRGKRSQALL